MTFHVIKVPDIGEGIAEVELVAWHVKEGDVVAEDQSLADVMTDKASVEIPSPLAGTVLALCGEVGQMLAVGSELIRIGSPADSGQAITAAAPHAAVPATPAPAKAVVTAPGATVAAPLPSKPSARPIASPALRARAWELGVDLADVTASGTAGRVMQADLDAHVAVGGARYVGSPPPSPSAPGQADSTHEIRIVGVRRKIAQKMQEAKRRIPHYTYVEEVDVGQVEALRAQLNGQRGSERTHLTLLPFLIRAIVLAVREQPQVNARFDDEAGVLSRFDAVHLGIATQTDAGLMVPVLRNARSRDLWGNAAEVARLADGARAGKLVRDELTGSTITLTSLGRLGGIASTPVINHPEVAIVGVNRIVQRPVICDGAVVARPMMNLSSSFDHRVVDGAVAAAFVQALRQRLEHPALLFVE